MGSLAGLFKASGWEVSGSDTGIYPPMSEQLARLGVPILEGFEAGHLESGPDLVVVGNIARADNPEAVEARRRAIPVTSMAEATARHFLEGRHAVVVAGTHGKTTTASLLAWTLTATGHEPSFLIGGVMANLGVTFRLGSGPTFVIEGDEYENAFFDRNPKFLHYQPRTAILTSIEWDHIEVFPDLEAVKTAFRRFLGCLPADGHLVACADDREIDAVVGACRAPVTRYSMETEAATRARLLEAGSMGSAFEVVRNGRLFGRFRSPLAGHHNLLNLTATVETLAQLGLGPEAIAKGLASFSGVHRRQELCGEVGEVAIIDDFAHHPTAVRETLRSLRTRFPGRRLVAVFEPRTNSSRRAVFQADYQRALAEADRVIVARVHRPELIPPGQRFDPHALVTSLRRAGTPADYLPQVDQIVADLSSASCAGDVIAVMSNGSFGGLPRRLLHALPSRARPCGEVSPPSRPASEGQ